jgi:hypothetical protein
VQNPHHTVKISNGLLAINAPGLRSDKVAGTSYLKVYYQFSIEFLHPLAAPTGIFLENGTATNNILMTKLRGSSMAVMANEPTPREQAVVSVIWALPTCEQRSGVTCEEQSKCCKWYSRVGNKST